ncbi:hypothetical protein C8R45DRAFT_1098952 [Mycena sanguinolenta]|nr:hypothetical protein C8R45DRAFT_1098952 [Mycena sanguinolenta]
MSDLPNLVMIATATDEFVGGAPASECGAQRAGLATVTKLGKSDIPEGADSPETAYYPAHSL